MTHRRWEKKMSEFKDLVIKIIYNETQKGKMLEKKKMNKRISEQWGNFTKPKAHMQLDAPKRKKVKYLKKYLLKTF